MAFAQSSPYLPDTDPEKVSTPASAIAGWVVGYIFGEIEERVAEARKGGFGDSGIAMGALDGFPESGFILFIRTIEDEKGEFDDIASVEDFINNAPETPASELIDQIVSSTRVGDQFILNETSLITAVANAIPKTKVKSSDKIAFLAICPTQKLEPISPHSADVFAITFAGQYYPLLAGNRFFFEDRKLSRWASKSNESLTFELYGPHGSSFTTGHLKLPLYWSPPSEKGSGADWVESNEIYEGLLKEDQLEVLREISELDTRAHLAGRSAFVKPSSAIEPLIYADFAVSEESDVNEWLSKGVEKVEDEAGDLIGDL